MSTGPVAAGTKPRLLMMGGALPQRLAPSAGAEYVTVLAEELSHPFDVTAIAPAYEANQAALDEGRQVVDSLLVGVGAPGLLRRVVGVVERGARSVDLALPPLYLAFMLFVDRRIRRLVRDADVVDMQWTEFVALAPLVRVLNPRALVLGTLHDSMTQVADRSDRRPGPFGILRRLRRAITARHEGRLPRSVDSLHVLNDKDARLVAALPGSGRTPEVIHPPRPVPGTVRNQVSPPEVLFVGAFGRAVNQEAVDWFLDAVWPTVLASRPDARLVLAGSDPQGAAAQTAGGRPDVHATGFVDDLGHFYARASVVAVPLRNGSGVKFKTIDALLHAVPVVSTTVGAEGIDGDDLFWSVTDSAPDFAAAVLEALDSPAARARAEAAARQVTSRYSRAAFASRIQQLYGRTP